MINLYVIKHIYYHIRKAGCFIEGREEGKKPKSVPIYQNVLPVSRQRFDRINKGLTFELSSRESDEIAGRLGIDMRYFRKDDPAAFEVDGIEGDMDWKCFYVEKYGVDYELPDDMGEKECRDRAGRVEQALRGLAAAGWEQRLDRDGPLFAVCHYFHYGRKADTPSDRKSLKEILGRLDYREWKDESMESLKEIQSLLKKHYSYINSLVTVDRLENEKNLKK